MTRLDRKNVKRNISMKQMMLATAAVASLAQIGYGATASWVGNTDALWQTGTNWTSGTGVGGAAAAGDILSFSVAGTAGTTLNNDFPAATSFSGINFVPGAAGFTFNGNSIALTGPIVVDSGGGNTETINFGINGGASSGISMSSATSTTGNNLALGADVTVGTLAATGKNVTALPSNTLTIGATNILTINGGIQVGDAGAASLDAARSFLAITGSTANTGTVIAGAAGAGISLTNIGNSTNTNTLAALNLSGLGYFSFNGGATGSVLIAQGQRGVGSLTLASTGNIITVGTIQVANGGSSNGGQGTINLGTGTNTLNVNVIALGGNKGGGTIQFATSNTTGTLKIRGTGGTDTDRAAITVNSKTTSGSPAGQGALVLGTHNVDILASTLTVVNVNIGGTGSLNNGTTGSVTFGAGVFDVNSMNILTKAGSGVLNTNGPTAGTFSMSGGNLTVNTSFSMTNTNNTPAQAFSNFYVLGGTATINADITQTGANAANTVIQLDGGTLDMTNHNIGTGAASLTLNALSGTLKNVAQINGGGTNGLNKTGANTLTLAGTNAYTGPTNITSGTVVLASGSTLANTSLITVGTGANLDLTALGGAYTVGSGRGLAGTGSVLGSVVVSSGGSLSGGGAPSPSSLTITGGLDLAGSNTLSITPNPSSPSTGGIIVGGALNTGGGASSVTINIPTGVGTGSFVLIDYGSITGTGFSAFTLAALPPRVIANLVNNTSNTSLDLNVTAVDFPVWSGAQSSEWSTNTISPAKNWVLNSNNLTGTDYIEGDSVLFNDSATTTTVDISVADVTPGTVTFNNSTKNYTITGSKAIAGAANLVKNGTGSVAIANNNTYTGGTVINSGTLQLGTGGTTGSVAGSITNNANLSLNKTGSYSFTNVVSGTGSVSQNGAATVTLSTANTYTGGTVVNAGTVRVTNATGAGTGSINVPTGGTLFIGVNLNNPLNMGGGTVGIGTFALGGDATFTAGTTTNFTLYDPNTPGTAQGNATFTGILHGSGTFNILANPGLVSLGTFNVDGSGAFRPLNNTGTGDFSGTMVLNPGVKGEIGASTLGFNTVGSAKIIMNAGTFNTGTRTGDFTILNLRNNSTQNNFVLGNNVEIVAGTGSFISLNPLDGGTPGPQTMTLGNLKVGGNLVVGVNKNGATANFCAFQSVTLTGGLSGATIFSPGTPNYDNSNTAILSLANIGETAAGASWVMGGNSQLILTGNHTYTGAATISNGSVQLGSGTVGTSIASTAGITNNFTLLFNSSAAVSVAGAITGTGTVIHAGAGNSSVAGRIAAGTLAVNAGNLKIGLKGTANSAAGTSVVQNLSINTGAVLDLTNNSMVVDYSTVGTLVFDIRSHLKSGRLTTTAVSPANTRLGYLDNATLGTPKTSFGGQPVDATSVLIKFTYSGDADLDGDADGVDIGTWATNFTGELGGLEGATRVWAQGDWDYDGDVDGVDAGLWATAFTGELGGSGLGSVVVNDPAISPQAAAILQGMGITVVPEPATLGLLGLCVAGGLARRGRRRILN